MVEKDCNANRFVMVKPWLRLTLLKDSQGEWVFRLNTFHEKGILMKGPEFAVSAAGELLQAMLELQGSWDEAPVLQPWCVNG